MTVPNIYTLDSTAKLSVAFTNVSGVAIDPTTVTFQYETPNGVVSGATYPPSGVITRSASGAYSSNLLIDQWGTWNYKWIGAASGVSIAAEGTLMGAGIIPG